MLKNCTFRLQLTLLFIVVAFAATAQSIDEGVVYLSSNQEAVIGAKLLVDGKEYVSNSEGKFLLQGYDLGRQPQKVVSKKDGLEVSSYVVIGNTLQITMRKPRSSVLVGQIVGEDNLPIYDLQVMFIDASPPISAKTDEQGRFAMRIPPAFRPSEESRFKIEDSKILNRAFEYREQYIYSFRVERKPAYLVLGKKFFVQVVNATNGRPLPRIPVLLGNKTYGTNAGGVFTHELRQYGDQLSFPAHDLIKIDSIPKQNKLIVSVLPTEKEVEVAPILVQADSADSVKVVTEVVEVASNPLLSSFNLISSYFNNPDSVIESAFLELNRDNLTNQEKANLTQALQLFRDRLSADQQTRLEQNKLLQDLDSLSDVYKSQEEILAEERERQEELQAKQQEQLLYGLGIGAILITITLVSVGFARQFRKQRNQIGKQATELEVLNVDLKSKNEQITDSIRAAELIQEAILPIAADIRNTFLENFILYRPKDIVSGDFYWFKQITDEQGRQVNFIAAIDCTGHGVPGAFMSMIGNTLLNEIITAQDTLETNEILEKLDKGVIAALKQETGKSDEGMDVCLCRIIYQKDETAEVEFTGAKRPLYVFMNNSDELITFNGTNRSIGGRQQNRVRLRRSKKRRMREKKPFEAHKIVLRKGSELYLSSDGLVDQNGLVDGEEKLKFGTKRLLDALKEHHNATMAEQSKLFNSLLDEYQGEADQRDDITLIGLRI